jgi:hypothetical protein
MWSRRVRVRSSINEALGEGVGDQEGAKEALGIAVELEHTVALLLGQEASQRLRLPLLLVNRLGLRPVLVDREDEAPVEELLVDFDRRRGQKDHHGALDPVLLGDEPTRRRVLAGRRDGELALGLEELERVARPLGPLLLDDGQHLVPQVALAHVEERLTGHRRVLHPLLVGDEGQDGVHERRLPGRRRALDDDRERLVELSRHRAEVADQLVRLLADHAAAGEVDQDAREEARVAEELERRLGLFVGQRDRLVGRLLCLGDLLLLQVLEREQDLAEVALDDVLLDPELAGGLADEDLTLARRVEVERVDEEGLAARREQVDPQLLEREVLRQAADPIAPVAESEDDLLAAQLR